MWNEGGKMNSIFGLVIFFLMLGMWGVIEEQGDTIAVLKDELRLHGCPVSDEELARKTAIRKYKRKSMRILR